MAKYSDLKLIRRILRQARPYWLNILGILLLSLLSTPLALLYPVPLKIAVDSVIGSQPLPGFLAVLLPTAIKNSSSSLIVLTAVLVVVIPLLDGIKSLGESWLRTYTGEKLVIGFRANLFRHVQRLSISYHDSKGTSDSLYRIQYDANAIKHIAIDGVIPLFSASFTFAAMLYVIFRIEWQLALIALTVSPALLLLGSIYRRHARPKWKDLHKLQSSAMSVVQEVLTMHRVVKAFGQENREHQRFVDRYGKALKANINLSLLESTLNLLISLTTAIGTGFVLFIGLRSVQAQTLTLGNLLLVIGYLSNLYSPLKTMSRKMSSLQYQLTSAERAFLLLEESPEVHERPNGRQLLRAKGAVSFRNVSFGYSNNRLVLQNISFDITPGTRLGIAGKTGAGKTSLLNLLTRFYDPTEGNILLDGVNLKDYKLADLRNQFSIVLQEPVLFSSSIAENIGYARPDASEEEIIKAARMANIHNFILNLPDGYQTEVGERGMCLSGGERQRIALARAFLKDAPILILDEPTSSVDMKTEAAIMEAIERLMKGRTTFMIAHRLSTLESCDLMLVMESGQMIACESEVSTTIREAMLSGGLEATIYEGKSHGRSV